jgi:peroxin-12
MAFVQLGGDHSARPTYFEVYAADKLVPSLRAAVTYTLSVLGQRRGWANRLLDYEDEVSSAVMLYLDFQSLRATSGTFAESIYGLRRAQLRGSTVAEPITRRQQLLALAAEVLVPLLRAKASRLYQEHTGRTVLGLALGRHRRGQAPPPAAHTPLQQLRRRALRLFLALYPYLHAGWEGAHFVYQLLYLLDASQCHSPLLQLLGTKLVRLTGPEVHRAEQQRAQLRQQQLQRAGEGRPRAAAALARAWVHASAALSDHSRSALVLAVFGFKALEWWYSSAEDALAANRVLPPPPAPRAPLPAPGGVGLPPSREQCPLCCKRRVNPAVLAVSGYVFCYPCVFSHVVQHSCCPVTRFPASLDSVRKLYDAS